MQTQPTGNFVDKINSTLESLAEWTGKHISMVLGVVVVALVIGAAITGFSYKKQNDEAKAMAEYSVLERDFSDWKMAQAPKMDPAAPTPPKVDAEQLFNKLVQFVEAKGDTNASQMAVLMATELAQKLNKEDQILEVIQKNLKLTGKSLLDGLTLIKKGDWLANADKCDEAISTWKQVTAKKDWSYLQDFAFLKSGLCLEKMNQFAEAETQYDQVINAKDAKQDRWAYKEAQKLKRSLKWSQKQGS